MTESMGLNRLKVALVERKRTARWLAKEINKSETTVSRWVSNRVQPSLEQLFEIAGILNMDVRELINYKQSQQ